MLNGHLTAQAPRAVRASWRALALCSMLLNAVLVMREVISSGQGALLNLASSASQGPVKVVLEAAAITDDQSNPVSCHGKLASAPLASRHWPLFMNRYAESKSVQHFLIPGLLYENATYSRNVSTLDACLEFCLERNYKSSGGCAYWTFFYNTSKCLAHPDLNSPRTWTRHQAGDAREGISGNIPFNITLWRNPFAQNLSVSSRRLLIVNFHHPTRGLSIMTYMVVHAGYFPVDFDVVFATPNVDGTLRNVWSHYGHLSYISLALAYAALPGYQGYLLTSDDAYINWDNVPCDRTTSWVSRIPKKCLSEKVKYAHEWTFEALNTGPDLFGWWPPVHYTSKMGFPSVPFSAGQRTREALLAARPKPLVESVFYHTADVFYVVAQDMPLVTAWIPIFAAKGSPLELAFPTILWHAIVHNTPPRNITSLDFCDISYRQNQTLRLNFPWLWINASVPGDTVTAYHPIKLSKTSNLQWMLRDINGFYFGSPLL